MNEPKDESRRKFLTKLTLGLGALPAAIAAIPVFSALLGPLLQRSKQEWRRVGSTADFPLGATKLVTFINADPLPWAGTTAKSAAWVRRETDQNFIAFSANCTHLGCPVRWEEKAELFMCPCHGGVYYKDGTVAGGPPPKELVRYQIRLNKDVVEIKTAPVPITNITA